ncbi:hypothetical protein, partial [Thiolapillus sp.]
DISQKSIDDTLENLNSAFAVALLKRWKFPAGFIEAVQYHHSQGQLESCTPETKIISYAHLIASHMDKFLHEVDEDAEIMATLGQQLGITLEQADEIRHEAIDYIDEMKNLN